MRSTPRQRRVSQAAGRALLVFATTLALLAVSLAVVPTAFAANTFTDYQLNLWPEYDDPRLLVIMAPKLDPSVSLPYTFSYGVPLAAQLGMACQILQDGAHDCQPQQSAVEGDTKTIAFSAPSQRDLFFEYYVDPFDGERPDLRQYTYSFLPPGDIGTLSVQIKQPKDAEGFAVEPAPQQTLTDSEGSSYLTYTFNEVKTGTPVDFSITYTRPTWEPPVQAGNAAAPLEAGGAQTGAASSNLLLWAIVGILAVVVVMMYRNQRSQKATK